MTAIVIIILVALFVVMPVKIAAKMCGAQNYGFFRVLIAVILISILSGLLGANVKNVLVEFAITTAVGAVIYSLLLTATFFQGLMISILSNVFAFLVAAALVAIFAALGIALG